MGSESDHARSGRADPVLGALTSPRRRVALAILDDKSAAVPVPELATHVAAAVRDATSVDVDRDARKRELVALVHRDLPKLDEAGLVEWDRENSVVTTTDHPLLADPNLRPVIESPTEGWDDILESLAHSRRRVILSVLVEHGGAIGRRNLARRTLARERDAPREAPSPDAVDEVLASLYHVHLPALREAGLLVDDGLETVRYADHPDLDAESLTVDASQASATRALATQ